MSFLNVKVLGISNLIRNLDRIQDTVDKDVQRALAVAAIRTESGAKTRSPIDTGRLRNSIRHKIGKHQASASVNVDYAAYIEFGTGRFVDFDSIEDSELRNYARQHAQQFKGQGVKQVNILPQPYLFPAFEEASRGLLRKLRTII